MAETIPCCPEDRRDQLYDRVIRGMAPALARMAAGFEADPAEREDLLQDIHLRIWRSLKRFDGDDPRAWAWRVAHNAAADHVAGAMRRGRTRPSATGEVERAEPRAGPAGSMVTTERAGLLMAGIRALPPADRHIVMLYLEGEPPKAIAELTGLSAGAVSVRVHRIRAALTRHIEEGEGR